MATRTTGKPTLDALYRVPRATVQFVEVPEVCFLGVAGQGAPGGEAFTAALQALYAVSYGAHFAVRKAGGEAPRVMPLEAQWWLEGDDALATMRRMAAGAESLTASDRTRWCWQAMIAQLPPIDEGVIQAAMAGARAKQDLPALGSLRWLAWEEGPSAQILHVGPYTTEGTSIATLHRAIAAHGSRPRGRHHEIYLGDPRTAAPDRLRTILRQPIEPLPA